MAQCLQCWLINLVSAVVYLEGMSVEVDRHFEGFCSFSRGDPLHVLETYFTLTGSPCTTHRSGKVSSPRDRDFHFAKLAIQQCKLTTPCRVTAMVGRSE